MAPRPRPVHAVAAAAAILFFILSSTGMSGKSAAYDEAVHLLSGFRILTEGDHDFNHEHPPLMKVLEAAPLVATGAARPLPAWNYKREFDQWPLSHDWLHHVNDADRLLRLARTPVAVVGGLLVLLVVGAAWSLTGGAGAPAGAREASPAAGGGGAPAMVAAASAGWLFATEPNLLAHGSLVTTDMGMAAFLFATTAAFLRHLETRGMGWLALTGILWGGALLTKFTAVLIGPMIVAMGAADIWMRRRDAARSPSGRNDSGRAPTGRSGSGARKPPSRALPAPLDRAERAGGAPLRLAVSILLIAMIALAVLNAGYGLDRSFSSLSGLRLESETFRSWAKGALGSVPIPAPAPFVMGYDHAEAGGRRWWSYLMGMHSMTGWRHYYLVALAVKTSIPLLLLAVAGALLWRRAGPVQGRRLILWMAPPALMLAAFTLSGNLKNIGLRYVLPVHPFLCLLGGIGAAALWRSWRGFGKAALAILILWAGAEEARIYPHHLAYFNEIAGGPRGGRWWLLDSNLDWGQDLKGLGVWMRENGVQEVYLDYFGRACPRYYGVGMKRDFEGGYLAVSATNLAGVYREDKTRYDFLQGVAPVASIGHSIFVYDVPRPASWTPAPDGSPE